MTVLSELDILIEEGLYKDKEALLQDAMRSLLRSKPELRSRLALALYKREKISLARGAEIAGVDADFSGTVSFKELLREAGIERNIASVGEDIESQVEKLIRMRNKS